MKKAAWKVRTADRFGVMRRNHLVPVPKATDLDSSNRWLEEQCHAGGRRRIAGRGETIGEAMRVESAQLRPLAAGSFDADGRQPAQVDAKGCIQAHTNFYSVPLAPGTKVEVRSGAIRVEIWREGRCLAWHERSYGRYEQKLNLEHYLTALGRKPGTFAGSSPLKQWRQAGKWPISFDRLWSAMKARQGESAGPRAMIGLLELGAEHGWAKLRSAVEEALELGSRDAEAMRHLLASAMAEPRQREAIPVTGRLFAFERPQPTLGEYDALPGAFA